jgi:transposase
VQPEAGREAKKMRYVGVDIGKWRCRAAVMDPEGTVIDEFAFNNDAEGIRDLASRLTTEDRVVMESTGSVWTNLYDALDERKVPVVLANPLKTRAIASARIKTDKVDARILAHLLRGDLVAECYVPPRGLREIRALVRHRASLVRARTTVKNRVHAIVDQHGLRCEYSDLFGKRSLEWLRSLDLGALDRLMLDNHLGQVESLNGQIRRVDEMIRSRGSLDEDVRLLLSLTGVDVYTALLIRSEVGCIDRFPDYKRLVSWAGLAPSIHQSGTVEYSGGITRQGSRMLRWAMVEAARVAVRHDERMRVFYERVKRRRGEGKAVVAVACKMLKVIWFMLSRREVYQSRNEGRYGRKLKMLGR